MESTEIQLFSNTFDVSQLTSQETRENLYLSINQLDVNKLTDSEIRGNFHGIRIALGVFIRKFVELECEIKDIKFQQVAYEAKMERLFLKGQMEIQELKQELSRIKQNEKNMKKVVEVARLLKDNDYAPVAIKSMMKGLTTGEILTNPTCPEDLKERVEFAQNNGFRWNKNNRPPAKMSKRIDILEGWEMEFYKAKSLTLEKLLDKEYVLNIGKGGPCGALVAIESVLGYSLEERKTMSTYNCYQRAIKLLTDNLSQKDQLLTNEKTSNYDLREIVLDVFGYSSSETVDRLTKGLSRLSDPSDPTQILQQLKIYFSADLIPRFIDLNAITNPLSILPKLQGNFYDEKIIEIINSHPRQ